jgi:hypothetical protein
VSAPFSRRGGVIFTPEVVAAHPGAGTVFNPFEADTTYFAPSTEDFMITLAVDDLDGILASCAKHGVEANVLPDEPDGRFARYSTHSALEPFDRGGSGGFGPVVGPRRSSAQ